MDHAPKVNAVEPNCWDLGNAVKETEKIFATDLQLLMNETTNDPLLLKTLVWLERQYTRRVYYIQKEAFHQIWRSLLRRPYHRPQDFTDNCDQPPKQGSYRYQQNFYGGQTFLVAKINRGHPEEMRRMYPVLDVR